MPAGTRKVISDGQDAWMVEPDGTHQHFTQRSIGPVGVSYLPQLVLAKDLADPSTDIEDVGLEVRGGTAVRHIRLSRHDVIFSTHLLPLARGILSTIYVTLGATYSGEAIETIFRKFYAGRSMVRLWPAGSLPELQHVAHTNFCDIGFSLDNSGKRLIVVSC